MFRACPDCGDVVEVTDQEPYPYCKGCLGEGRKFSVMDVTQLFVLIERDIRNNLERKAEKHFGIAINLTRYVAIDESLHTASDAYREAIRDGLDPNDAHDSAMDELSELMRAYDDAVNHKCKPTADASSN